MSLDLTLRHSFPGLTLDLSLTCPPGVTALFGPSGAGKSTVIRAIAGLLTPDMGHISLNGTALTDTDQSLILPPHKRRLGVVFQEARLFPHLSVAQNLSFASRYRKGAPLPVSEADLISLLGIEALLPRMPGALSGGEAQRVALARALLSAPAALLLDEPLAALDGPRKDELLPYLERLKSAANIPILYVTHSVSEIARLADHMALLVDGKLHKKGTVTEMLADPTLMPWLGVREAGSLLSATVMGPADHGLTRLDTGAGQLELPGVAAAKGETIRLRIPAHDVILATEKPKNLSARNILKARVASIEAGRGPGVAVVLALGDQTILARITEASRQDLALRADMAVWIVLKATAVSRVAIGA